MNRLHTIVVNRGLALEELLQEHGPLQAAALRDLMGWTKEGVSPNASIQRIQRAQARTDVRAYNHHGTIVFYLPGQEEVAKGLAEVRHSARVALQQLQYNNQRQKWWSSMLTALAKGPCTSAQLAKVAGVNSCTARKMAKAKWFHDEIGMVEGEGNGHYYWHLPEHRKQARKMAARKRPKRVRGPRATEKKRVYRKREKAPEPVSAPVQPPIERAPARMVKVSARSAKKDAKALAEVLRCLGVGDSSNAKLLAALRKVYRLATKRDLQRHLKAWRVQGLVREVRPGRWTRTRRAMEVA